MDMAPWQETMETAAANVLARCERERDRPPRVAFCIAGAARGFATHLMQNMLRLYLVKMLAPLGAAGGSRIFLQLKPSDSDKLAGWGDFDIHFHAHTDEAESRTSRLRALIEADSWLRPLLAEVAIINGSGSFMGVGRREGSAHDRSSTADSAIRPSDPEAWRFWSSSTCKVPYGTRPADSWSTKKQRHPPTSRKATAELQRNSKLGAGAAGNTEERLILAALGPAWCDAAIVRHEQATGQAFETVVFVRPDQLLQMPVVPWCELPRGAAVACGGSGADGIWVVPRRSAWPLLHRAELHAACTDPKQMRLSKVDRFRGGGVVAKASCCGAAEALLTHALHVSRRNSTQQEFLRHSQELRVDSKSCSKLGWPGRLFLRQVQRIPPRVPCSTLHFTKVGECNHIHRHTCDAALNPRYVPGGQWSRIQAYHNSMTMETAKLFRKLFRGNSSWCYDALRYDGYVR